LAFPRKISAVCRLLGYPAKRTRLTYQILVGDKICFLDPDPSLRHSQHELARTRLAKCAPLGGMGAIRPSTAPVSPRCPASSATALSQIEPTFPPPLQWNSSEICCVFRQLGDPGCGASVATRARGGHAKTLLGWILVGQFWAGSCGLQGEPGAGSSWKISHAEQGDEKRVLSA
jgi:hypothetical protein